MLDILSVAQSDAINCILPALMAAFPDPQMAGLTWTPLTAGGLQTGLFYNIDIKPDASASVTVGALQDNGLRVPQEHLLRTGVVLRAVMAGMWFMME